MARRARLQVRKVTKKVAEKDVTYEVRGAGPGGSGPSHVRYGHVSRPTEIAVVCPRCGGEALATIGGLPEAGIHVMSDLSRYGRGKAWRVACLACSYRTGPFEYEELRAQSPLYFTLERSGEDLWAWNREHLRMLLDVFSGGDGSSSSYAWLTTYIHGRWKARASHYAKLAQRLLAR